MIDLDDKVETIEENQGDTKALKDILMHFAHEVLDLTTLDHNEKQSILRTITT